MEIKEEYKQCATKIRKVRYEEHDYWEVIRVGLLAEYKNMITGMFLGLGS